MKVNFNKAKSTRIELGDLIITDIDNYLVIQERTKIKLLSLTNSVIEHELPVINMDIDSVSDLMLKERIIKIIKSCNLELKEI